MTQQSTMLQYIGPSSGGSCGYCKGVEKINFRVWFHRGSPLDYNDFLNLGWRRSGKYLYKPIMEKTCCPQYTIRLDVHKFRMSRTQKRVLKTMLEYLKFDKKPEIKNDKTLGYKDVKHEPPKKKENSSKKEMPFAKKEKGDCPVEKKKVMRRKRALDKLRKKDVNISEYQRARMEKEKARRRTIASYLCPYVEGVWKHKLEIRLVKKGTPEFDESFVESFRLYRKYQQTVHKDIECTQSGYENFLINTPLITTDDITGVPALGFLGSYHQQYLIDGRIIAVGVVDILPQCLSSKYFYYDPDFSFLTLGTYSALREILFIQELAKTRPELHYYYMGYFLISCPKMRYKGRFRPSELLCDHSYQWVPLIECEPMILENEGKFTIFRPNISPPPCPDILSVKCIFNRSIMTYGGFREYLEDPEEWDEKLQQYVKYSRNLSTRVLLCL